jgi:hypothetical protein
MRRGSGDGLRSGEPGATSLIDELVAAGIAQAGAPQEARDGGLIRGAKPRTGGIDGEVTGPRAYQTAHPRGELLA